MPIPRTGPFIPGSELLPGARPRRRRRTTAEAISPRTQERAGLFTRLRRRIRDALFNLADRLENRRGRRRG